MSVASSRWIVLALVSWIVSAVSLGAQEPLYAPRLWGGRHIFLMGKPGMVVNRALDGAMKRLATAECQEVFQIFADRQGHPLTVSLDVIGIPPADALARVYFVEGDETSQCRGTERIAAYTEPGSRVVHICGKRFAAFAQQTKPGEILLIHEFLHTLGLGENPPSSDQISKAVMRRCGG